MRKFLHVTNQFTTYANCDQVYVLRCRKDCQKSWCSFRLVFVWPSDWILSGQWQAECPRRWYYFFVVTISCSGVNVADSLFWFSGLAPFCAMQRQVRLYLPKNILVKITDFNSEFRSQFLLYSWNNVSVSIHHPNFASILY